MAQRTRNLAKSRRNYLLTDSGSWLIIFWIHGHTIILQSTQDDNENSDADSKSEDNLDDSNNKSMKTMQSKAMD